MSNKQDYVLQVPLVSVVIPCFNQGQFIDEAIESVLSQTLDSYEIIVINDGSTDYSTVNRLYNLDFPNTRVIHTDNQGLSSARNNGIREAKGKYILPLDADDRIGQTYLEQAVTLLNEDSELGIVYCKGQYFGDRNDEWILPDYSLEEMLLNNVIFCTAFFRRADWETVGGFDPSMIYGWEDYDFWLSLIEMGRNVKKIPEILFYYRIRSDSMLRSCEKKKKVESLVRIFHKHESLYKQHVNVIFEKLVDIKGVYLEAVLFCREKNSGFKKPLGVRRIDVKTNILSFEIASLSIHDKIYLCPVNNKAVIDIKNIYTETIDRNVDILSFDSNAVLVDGSIYYFITTDPLLTIRQEMPNQSIKLIIELDYLIIGETVPDHLVSRINQELTVTKTALAGLHGYINRKERTRLFSLKAVIKHFLFFSSNKEYRIILRSGLFDRKFYLNKYPDVFFQEVDPLVHYCKIGWKEKRKPNSWFNPEEYCNTTDVCDGVNPLLHYLERGDNS